jgi:LDH2 family malate/lactate/ureidoglycolate dehydrogenase
MAPKKLSGTEPRVDAAELLRWATACLAAAGCREADATMLAELLIETDLRGVSSHGTVLMGMPQEYIKHMLTGDVNPRPNITIITETATTRAFDGDGGLGHLAMAAACEWAVPAAKKLGTAVATTRNHFHVGSAGKWTRRATEAGLIAICVSSHRYPLPPGAASHQDGPAGALRTVNQNSPISIGIPAGDRPPVVLDMAAGLLPWDEDLFEQSPNAFFKELGLGAIARVLGGVLPGV